MLFRSSTASANGEPASKSDTASVRLILAAPGGGGGGRSSDPEENEAMITLSCPWLRGFTLLGAPATSDVARAFGAAKGPKASGRLRRSSGPHPSFQPLRERMSRWGALPPASRQVVANRHA